MNLEELKKKIQEALDKMKQVVKSDKSSFPSFHFDKEDGEETIKAIT